MHVCSVSVVLMLDDIMKKRTLNIDYSSVDGSLSHKKVLKLVAGDDNCYNCPVSTCLHDPYRSMRGARKHVNQCHPWWYWFDEAPRLHRRDAFLLPRKTFKAATNRQPSFSIKDGIGLEFHSWLLTACGGGKVITEANQIATRAMKFLMAVLGETSQSMNITTDQIDFCIGSPANIINFLQKITAEWELSSSGALNYLRAVSDLMDFRKANGVTDSTLRTYAVSEVYIRRGLGNLARKKKIEYSRNLDLEQLIARDSWATLSDLESVVPHHTPKFEQIVRKARENPKAVTINEVAFSTRFIVTFLFLRVKCTRPMTYKFLTLDMVDRARREGGYVDTSLFKTESTYTFDTLILSEDTLAVLTAYIQDIRPLAHPTCEYVLVNTAGKQFTALGTAMSLLVYQAIGKMIHPTRYRQIVESESSERLTLEEQEQLSKDQKHSSCVAKRIYKKKLSRDVADQGLSCINKLVGDGREHHTNVLARSLATEEAASCTTDVILVDRITQSSAVAQIESDATHMMDLTDACDSDDATAIDATDITATSDDTDRVEVISTNATNSWTEKAEVDDGVNALPIPASISTTITTTHCSTVNTLTPTTSAPISTVANAPQQLSTTSSDVEVKREEVSKHLQQSAKLLRFTPEEDKYLRTGTQKYGLSKWAAILKDEEYVFHQSRTRDSLRIRAETIGLTKRRKGGRKTKNV